MIGGVCVKCHITAASKRREKKNKQPKNINMEFTLSTAGYFYPEANSRKKLEDLGFTFKPSDYKDFTIQGNPVITINTLEELINFSNTIEGEIIVGEGRIEIYDDYRE